MTYSCRCRDHHVIRSSSTRTCTPLSSVRVLLVLLCFYHKFPLSSGRVEGFRPGGEHSRHIGLQTDLDDSRDPTLAPGAWGLEMPKSVGFAKSEHSCNFWNLSDTELMALLHFGIRHGARRPYNCIIIVRYQRERAREGLCECRRRHGEHGERC